MSELNATSLAQLAKAADAFVTSERRGRWFGNFLKLSIAVYLLGSLALLANNMNLADVEQTHEPHIAVVAITGAIMPESPTSANAIMPLLKDAFENKNSQAVMLKLNSPGGSAVQSGLIYDDIMRLKKLHNKPVYAVAEDLCASGCYYIASAADKIFADKASIIGSIGVRFDSFGVTGLMDKLGVENRSLAAGEHKRLLDPFSPADTQAQQHLQTHVLARTHEQFKRAVREGRGQRLTETPELFTGLVWIGDEAVGMGLIDGLGEMHSVARNELNLDKLVEYATEEAWLDRLSKGIGSQLSQQLSQQVGLKF